MINDNYPPKPLSQTAVTDLFKNRHRHWDNLIDKALNGLEHLDTPSLRQQLHAVCYFAGLRRDNAPKWGEDCENDTHRPINSGQIRSWILQYGDSVLTEIRHATPNHLVTEQDSYIETAIIRAKNTLNIFQGTPLEATENRIQAALRRLTIKTGLIPAKRYSDSLFTTGKDRLYFPMPATEISPTQRDIRAFLTEHGYEITDYAKNICRKNQQDYKIGKILKKLETPALTELLKNNGFTEIDFGKNSCKDSQNNVFNIQKTLALLNIKPLYHAFETDSSRNQNLVIVLSRHPVDLARMSTRRAWNSCTSVGGLSQDAIEPEIAAGTLIGYVIRSDDPTITNPLCRILYKPYRNILGQTILKPDILYGLKHPELETVLSAYIDAHFNHGKKGDFNIHPKSYSIGMTRKITLK